MRYALQNALFVSLLLALSAACGSSSSTSKKRPAIDPNASIDSVCKTKPSVSLRLYDDDALTRDQNMLEAALSEQAPEGFVISVSSAYRNATGADASHFELVQSFDGVPICGFHQKAHITAGELSLPSFPQYDPPTDLTDSAFGDAHVAVAVGAATMGLTHATIKIRHSTRCLQPVNQELVPAFDSLATIGNAPYRVIGNANDTFMIESQLLDLSATAEVYKRNPLDGQTASLPVEVSDSGALDSANARLIDAYGTVSGPKAVDGKLTPAVNSPGFLEVSLFAHVQEQLAYDLQFRPLADTDCMPIEIKAHAGKDEGPQYLPSWFQEDTGHPRIVVPDAIPGLQNLALDYDAVAHETNHHFVYQRLKSLSHEPSKVIHEGLADYFVFSHTGDTCLAESICPADTSSTLCVVPGKCLRSGDFTQSGMKFYTDQYIAQPYHKKSQALSGLLIAIGKEPTVGAEQIAKIMFAGIDYLKEKSELSDWLEAVLQGDKVTYGGVHACTIVAKAKDYGLVNEAAAIDCNTYQTK